MTSSGVGIPGASVELTDSDRGVRMKTHTDRTGLFVFAGIMPGRYIAVVSSTGFISRRLTGLAMSTHDELQQNFYLAAGSPAESDATEAKSAILQRSGTVSTVVDPTLVRELPLNGLSFQTLFELTPGVVITAPSPTTQGQFSVNGQRPNANYFVVDADCPASPPGNQQEARSRL